MSIRCRKLDIGAHDDAEAHSPVAAVAADPDIPVDRDHDLNGVMRMWRDDAFAPAENEKAATPPATPPP